MELDVNSFAFSEGQKMLCGRALVDENHLATSHVDTAHLRISLCKLQKDNLEI